MKTYGVKQLDDKDEKIADALISLGMSHCVAWTLCYLRNVDEAGGDNGAVVRRGNS